MPVKVLKPVFDLVDKLSIWIGKSVAWLLLGLILALTFDTFSVVFELGLLASRKVSDFLERAVQPRNLVFRVRLQGYFAGLFVVLLQIRGRLSVHFLLGTVFLYRLFEFELGRDFMNYGDAVVHHRDLHG